MKTIFDIDKELWGTVEENQAFYDVYDNYYKHQGWILDKECEEIYRVFEEKLDFNIGDDVTIETETRTIIYKRTDIVNGVIYYSLDLV